MIRFNNDYNHGAHCAILKAFNDTNDLSYPGYGLDEWCEAGSNAIKKYLGDTNTQIHFLLGGTQANYTVIASALRPFQGVISTDCAHINAHETGAVENTGHKILTCENVLGKLTAENIEKIAVNYAESGIKEHITQPKLVFISSPSEYGTIYSKAELTAIREVCNKYNMYLYVDGARMGYGLGSVKNDMSLEDFANLCDVFYIGGTKCGALFGEAVVIVNDELKDNFRAYIKQNGGMLAKGWLAGLQFYTLFNDGLYFEITKKADDFAMDLKKAFNEKNIPFYIESFTNQQFVILSNNQIKNLSERYSFEFEGKIDETHSCVRFCTSWSTTKEEIDTLIADIDKL